MFDATSCLGSVFANAALVLVRPLRLRRGVQVIEAPTREEGFERVYTVRTVEEANALLLELGATPPPPPPPPPADAQGAGEEEEEEEEWRRYGRGGKGR